MYKKQKKLNIRLSVKWNYHYCLTIFFKLLHQHHHHHQFEMHFISWNYHKIPISPCLSPANYDSKNIHKHKINIFNTTKNNSGLTWGSASNGKSRVTWKSSVTRGGYDADAGGSPHSPRAPTSNKMTIVIKRHTWATCLVVCSVSEKARLSRLTAMMPGKELYLWKTIAWDWNKKHMVSAITTTYKCSTIFF